MLRTRFDDASHVLTIRSDGRTAARAATCARPWAGTASRSFLRAVLRRRAARAAEGPACARPQLFRRRPQGGLDHQSRIGLQRSETAHRGAGPSVALSRQCLCRGWPAWHEFDLLGQEIAIGDARGSRSSSGSCAARPRNVDPDTGARDLAVPETLLRSFRACRLRRVRRGDRERARSRPEMELRRVTR